MNKKITSANATADEFQKLAAATLKLSISIGCICIIAYSIRISHFPQGLSLGDSLLFILTATCFGFVYIIFLASLTGLGLFFSFVFRPITKGLIAISRKKTRPQKTHVRHEMIRFEKKSIILSIFAGIFIYQFGKVDPSSYITLPLLSAFLYIFYSILKSSEKTYRHSDRLTKSLIITKEREKLIQSNEISSHRTQYYFALSIIIISPLLISGVSGQILDSAMRLAKIRLENPVIYIKYPYADLLPPGQINTKIKSPLDFLAYDDVIVLFRGFGNTSVIEFKDGNKNRTLGIPNDHIIIE